MSIYRIETIIINDGLLQLEKLPFQAGDKVEVIVRSRRYSQELERRYPLRGTPIRYIDPFKSIAENDWQLLQ